ncbi:hypothetical protein AB0F43_10900 [Kribbella sp. NPDC023972]|uniref:hypothetical protein n=1 Tax=Kribbella sp. NPDC023972 TaxID=3154795 RepID=UPI0033DB75A5
MTDAVQAGTEWVPPIGMLEVPAEHAAVIRGLFELAAFVADHPELPAPDVDAGFYSGRGDWESKRAVVDRVAGALGEQAVEDPRRGSYGVRKLFGPVRAWAAAFTAESMAAHAALLSYSRNVQPEASADAAGGAR